MNDGFININDLRTALNQQHNQNINDIETLIKCYKITDLHQTNGHLGLFRKSGIDPQSGEIITIEKVSGIILDCGHPIVDFSEVAGCCNTCGSIFDARCSAVCCLCLLPQCIRHIHQEDEGLWFCEQCLSKVRFDFLLLGLLGHLDNARRNFANFYEYITGRKG